MPVSQLSTTVSVFGMIVAHGRRLVDMLLHCQLGIEINAQVSNSGGRLNYTGADLERPLIGLQLLESRP